MAASRSARRRARRPSRTPDAFEVTAPAPRVVPYNNPDVFTLKARDVCTPATMRYWALQAAEAGSPAAKIGDVLLHAVEVERWQKTFGAKVPD